MAKPKITTSNFLYFLSERGYRNHALVEGGIVNTPAFNWGEPMDEIEAIIPLQEGGIVSEETIRLLESGRDHETPISIGFDPALNPDLPPRKCFNCQKDINYVGFSINNHWKMTKEQLKKIWESPYVELFCCTCFRKGVYLDKIIKKRERLLNKAYRINEKFGFLID